MRTSKKWSDHTRMADAITPAVLGGEQPQVQNPAADAAPAKVENPSTPVTSSEPLNVEQILSGLDVTKLTDDQLADLESGDPQKLANLLKVPASKPEEKKTDTAGGSSTAAEVEEGQGVGARPPVRVSLKSIPEPDSLALVKALSGVKTGQYKTLTEALSKEFKISPAQATAAADAILAESGAPAEAKATATPDLAVHPKIQEIEGRIKELTQQRDKAKSEFDYESAESLQDAIMEAKFDLRQARQVAESEITLHAEWTKKEDESRDKVLTKYAEFTSDPEHNFNLLLDMEVTRAEKAHDPILQSPDWPEKIADRVFEKHKELLGYVNSDPKDDDVPATIPLAPRSGVRLPGAPVGGGANSAALTASAALSEFDKLSPDEQKAVMARLDKSMV